MDALGLVVSPTMRRLDLNGANEGGPNGRSVVQLILQLSKGIISPENVNRVIYPEIGEWSTCDTVSYSSDK